MLPDPEVIAELAAYYRKKIDAITTSIQIGDITRKEDLKSTYELHVPDRTIELAKRIFLDEGWVGPNVNLYTLPLETRVPDSLLKACNHIAASVHKQLGIPIDQVRLPVTYDSVYPNALLIRADYFEEVRRQLEQERSQERGR